MTLRERRALRSAILAELAGVEAQCTALAGSLDDIIEASRMSNVDDEHDPEGTTVAFERAQVTALLRHARNAAGPLREALQRVDDEEYGVCRICRKSIGVERLLALPAAERCIRCAR